MSEGTNVGNIYLDLVVRDTADKQVQKIAETGQQAAQKAFSGVEKAAESMAASIARQAAKPAETVAASFDKGFSKPVELAKAKLRQLEKEFSRLSTQAEELMRKDTTFQIYGYVSEDNKAFYSVEKQLDSLYSRMEAARERLSIEVQAAANKQAEAEEKAAKRAAAAAEKAAATAAREAERRAAAERKAAAEAEAAAQKAAAAEEKAANRRRGILASMWKNMLSSAGDSCKKISSKITGIIKNFTTAGKTAQRFSSRLRRIVSGALIFNGISAALRSMTSYFTETITASDEMSEALSNLKGAAANAASPIIQILTPALTNLANAAATVLTYVERLMTRLTGKVSNAAAVAEKSTKKAVSSAQKAARTLAGFDELNRLDSEAESSGAGGEDKEDAIQPNYGFKGFNPFLESILSAIEAGNWDSVGTLIAEKLNRSLEAIPWDSIQAKVKRWTQNLVDTLNGFIHKVDWGMIGTTLGNGLNTILLAMDTFFQGVDWLALGTGIASGLNKLFDSIDWPMLGRVLTDKLKALFEVFHGFVTNFDFSTFGKSLAQMLNAAFDNINWGQLYQDIKACLAGLFDAICAFFAELEPDTLGAVISVLLLKAAKAAFKVLAPEVGKLLAKNLTDGVTASFGSIGTWFTGTFVPKIIAALGSIGSWITGTLVPGISAALGGIASALGISVGWVAAIGAAIAALVVVIVKHWDDIVAWTKKAWEKVKEIMTAIPGWIDKKIITPVTEFFSEMREKLSETWGKIKESASNTWEKVSAAVTSKAEDIRSKVVSSFTKVKENLAGIHSTLKADTSSAWNNMFTTCTDAASNIANRVTSTFASVKSTVSSIWSGIVSSIKSAVNGIIGCINGMIYGITNGINTVIRALNRLKFTIPSWFQYVPGAANLAGKSIGFNIQELTARQIPYLAQGGVITQPTLAMVGEYSGASSNPEIVAPQSLIAETVASVMKDVVLKNQMSLVEVVSILRQILNAVVSISSGNIRATIGGHEVFQAVVDENNMAVLRTGNSPLKV